MLVIRKKIFMYRMLHNVENVCKTSATTKRKENTSTADAAALHLSNLHRLKRKVHCQKKKKYYMFSTMMNQIWKKKKRKTNMCA